MQDFAEQFYKSSTWKNVQALVMRRDKALCVECLKNGIVTPASLVHHIKPITRQNIDDPTITLNMDNLEALCTKCHETIHKKVNQVRRFSVDKNGNISPRQ